MSVVKLTAPWVRADWRSLARDSRLVADLGPRLRLRVVECGSRSLALSRVELLCWALSICKKKHNDYRPGIMEMITKTCTC